MLALFLVPVLAALVVSLLVRRRGLGTNVVLSWFVIVCWIGALGVILAQVR
ncbi:MAG: hypothetical protein JHC82_02970 [Stenotrophomonas sp.]|jgi:pheromone shutdown protein TraB|nr:hypothetical protein [Stenotrophomonas sp.]